MINKFLVWVIIFTVIIAVYFVAKDIITPAKEQDSREIIKISADASRGSSAYNDTAIKAIEGLIESCTDSEIFLYYGLGSQNIILKKYAVAKNKIYCAVSISGEIEMGKFSYNCSVPETDMQKWKSWKDTEIPGSIEEISEFCRRI